LSNQRQTVFFAGVTMSVLDRDECRAAQRGAREVRILGINEAKVEA